MSIAPVTDRSRHTRERLHEVAEHCECLGDVECVLGCCVCDEKDPDPWAMDGAAGSGSPQASGCGDRRADDAVTKRRSG